MNSTQPILEKLRQTKTDMLRVTVAFESNGKSRTALITFPEDVSHSDMILETLLPLAVGAIDSWVETSKPTRLHLKRLMELAYSSGLKQRSIKSPKTSPTKRSSRNTQKNSSH